MKRWRGILVATLAGVLSLAAIVAPIAPSAGDGSTREVSPRPHLGYYSGKDEHGSAVRFYLNADGMVRHFHAAGRHFHDLRMQHGRVGELCQLPRCYTARWIAGEDPLTAATEARGRWWDEHGSSHFTVHWRNHGHGVNPHDGQYRGEVGHRQVFVILRDGVIDMVVGHLFWIRDLRLHNDGGFHGCSDEWCVRGQWETDEVLRGRIHHIGTDPDDWWNHHEFGAALE